MENGERSAFGTHSELLNSNIDFISLLKEDVKDRNRKPLQNEKSVDELYVSETSSKRKLSEQISCANHLETESRTFGLIGWKIYWQYFRSGAGPILLSTTLIITIFSQTVFYYIDFWLAAWSDESKIGSIDENSTPSIISNNSTHMNETTDQKNQVKMDSSNNILVYSFLIAILIITTFFRTISLYFVCLSSSISLHNQIFKSILQAPIVFFDKNPIGRILSRFTQDIGNIDTSLPPTLLDINLQLSAVIGIVISTIIVKPILVVPVIILLLMVLPFKGIYIRTSRDVKRIEATSNSPVFSQIINTYQGLTSLRSFSLQNKFEKHFITCFDEQTSCKIISLGTRRAIAFILDFLVAIYVLCIAIVLMVIPGDIPPGEVGLLLSTSMALSRMFSSAIRLTVEFETQMVSVERVIDYGRLPSEEPSYLTSKIEPAKDWPKFGSIEFHHVYLTYPNNMTPVLRNLNLVIKSGEKIGIVGRTGAGKSSLISVLFRLVEPDGLILIDGVDTKKIRLNDVRSKISIIPQDPVLFTGSIRKNLDPFNEYADTEVWKILNELQLDKMIKDHKGLLDAQLSEGGSNISVGQRQLICLARALLKQNKILILDEATANVDHETDAIIQKTIRTNFKTRTVLTIAHRLNTIIDMDKIMLIESGEIVEFDEPYKLLIQNSGHFKRLVAQTGQNMSQVLYKKAKDVYDHKQS